MFCNPNINGLKYFLYIFNIYKNIPYLPEEIREIIWKMSEKIPYIICLVNNNIELKLKLNIHCKK